MVIDFIQIAMYFINEFVFIVFLHTTVDVLLFYSLLTVYWKFHCISYMDRILDHQLNILYIHYCWTFLYSIWVNDSLPVGQNTPTFFMMSIFVCVISSSNFVKCLPLTETEVFIDALEVELPCVFPQKFRVLSFVVTLSVLSMFCSWFNMKNTTASWLCIVTVLLSYWEIFSRFMAWVKIGLYLYDTYVTRWLANLLKVV